MITIEAVKQEYAEQSGYASWEVFIKTRHETHIYWDEIMQETCDKLNENLLVNARKIIYGK